MNKTDWNAIEAKLYVRRVFLIYKHINNFFNTLLVAVTMLYRLTRNKGEQICCTPKNITEKQNKKDSLKCDRLIL